MKATNLTINSETNLRVVFDSATVIDSTIVETEAILALEQGARISKENPVQIKAKVTIISEDAVPANIEVNIVVTIKKTEVDTQPKTVTGTADDGVVIVTTYPELQLEGVIVEHINGKDSIVATFNRKISKGEVDYYYSIGKANIFRKVDNGNFEKVRTGEDNEIPDGTYWDTTESKTTFAAQINPIASTQEIQKLTYKVEVGDTSGESNVLTVQAEEVLEPITIKSIKDITEVTEVGSNYTLPTLVAATMSNDTVKNVSVTWNPLIVDTSETGSFTFNGTVDGYEGELTLVLTVKRYPNATIGGEVADIKENNIIDVEYVLGSKMEAVVVEFKEVVTIKAINVTGGNLDTNISSENENSIITQLAKFNIKLVKEDGGKIIKVESDKDLTKERIDEYGNKIVVTLVDGTTFTINLVEKEIK